MTIECAGLNRRAVPLTVEVFDKVILVASFSVIFECRDLRRFWFLYYGKSARLSDVRFALIHGDRSVMVFPNKRSKEVDRVALFQFSQYMDEPSAVQFRKKIW